MSEVTPRVGLVVDYYEGDESWPGYIVSLSPDRRVARLHVRRVPCGIYLPGERGYLPKSVYAKRDAMPRGWRMRKPTGMDWITMLAYDIKRDARDKGFEWDKADVEVLIRDAIARRMREEMVSLLSVPPSRVVTGPCCSHCTANPEVLDKMLIFGHTLEEIRKALDHYEGLVTYEPS